MTEKLINKYIWFFLSWLTILFILLKVLNYIDWSWWIVCFPIYPMTFTAVIEIFSEIFLSYRK